MARPTENKEDKNPNNKKGLEMSPNFIMLISNCVMLLVIIVAMVVMYTLFNSSIDRKLSQITPNDEQNEIEEDGSAKEEGILLDLGEFILNLADTNARRYLKVGIAMELSKTQEELNNEAMLKEAKGGHGAPSVDPNQAIIAEMDRYKPAIRDAVISVLSNKTSDELSTPTGKEIAKEEILEMVNNIFEGHREASRVSFGQFIIQ